MTDCGFAPEQAGPSEFAHVLQKNMFYRFILIFLSGLG